MLGRAGLEAPKSADLATLRAGLSGAKCACDIYIIPTGCELRGGKVYHGIEDKPLS